MDKKYKEVLVQVIRECCWLTDDELKDSIGDAYGDLFDAQTDEGVDKEALQLIQEVRDYEEQTLTISCEQMNDLRYYYNKHKKQMKSCGFDKFLSLMLHRQLQDEEMENVAEYVGDKMQE